MTRFSVQVLVTPRPGLLDPQGKAIHRALSSLGYDSVAEVRVGRAITLSVSAPSADAAEDAVSSMCRKLLANPVTEDFRVRAAPETAARPGASDGVGGKPEAGLRQTAAARHGTPARPGAAP